MKTIEFQEYEINDLLRTLYYARDKKMEDYKMRKINLAQSQYEIGIIKDLIAKVPIKSYTDKRSQDRCIVSKDNSSLIDLF